MGRDASQGGGRRGGASRRRDWRVRALERGTGTGWSGALVGWGLGGAELCAAEL